MKKLIALLLALMLALALAVPASAAGEDIGIIGGADGPTYILVSADPKAAATVSKEQREQNIKELGGVVGQVNVLLGDRCIAFTDAVPEVKNGRTMVPLRAALEAMGARIEFDQATKTAIVTGEKASFTHVVGSDVITRADGSTVKGMTLMRRRVSGFHGRQPHHSGSFSLAFLGAVDLIALASPFSRCRSSPCRRRTTSSPQLISKRGVSAM